MAGFGWYVLIGFGLLAGISFYLQQAQIEGKLKEQISVAFGGMIVLLLWPVVIGTALISALRKKSPDE